MARGDKADLFFRKLRSAGLSKPAVQTLAERLDALEAADSAASGASMVVPGVVVETGWNTDGTIAFVGKYDAAGAFTSLVMGADTGIPWLRYETGALYVPITSVIAAQLTVSTTGVTTPVVKLAAQGLLGSLTLVCPPNNDSSSSGQVVFYGSPASFASGPTGWQQVSAYVEANAAGVTGILTELAEISGAA